MKLDGRKLKKLFTKKGIKNTNICLYAGIRPPNLSNFLTGKTHSLKEVSFNKIADYLGMMPVDLVRMLQFDNDKDVSYIHLNDDTKDINQVNISSKISPQTLKQYLVKTENVLVSETVYAGALAANIDAFDEAVEVSRLHNDKLQRMERDIQLLKKAQGCLEVAGPSVLIRKPQDQLVSRKMAIDK